MAKGCAGTCGPPGIWPIAVAREADPEQDAVANASADLAGKQQADHARNTYGNLFAEVLLSVCCAIRSVPSLARGEGGFVSREYVGGFYKEAGLDCKLIQGGSGVKTREIIASSQGDIGIGDITHPMQLSNHGRAGRVLMPVDTRSGAVIFIIRKHLKDQGITTLEQLAAAPAPFSSGAVMWQASPVARRASFSYAFSQVLLWPPAFRKPWGWYRHPWRALPAPQPACTCRKSLQITDPRFFSLNLPP